MPLFMYVGKMRQGKSYCAVKKTTELTKENQKNLQSNREVFASHLAYFTDRGMGEAVEQFMPLLDCEQYPEYHQELKVPFDEFIQKYNKENGTKLETLKPVRQIYTDIAGIHEIGKIPNLLPAPDDWRTTPKGSIIFYDEFQIHREAFKFDGNKLSKDPMIIDISTIGHVDKDLYLITQDAENLNFSLRKLIDKMYFVKRPPQNIPACSVYTFDCFLKNPKAAAESQREPKKYIHWEVLKYSDSIYELYKSASSHDSIKRKIPMMFFVKVIAVILLFALVTYGIVASPFLKFLSGAIKTMMHSSTSSVSDIAKPKTETPTASIIPNTSAVPKPFDVNTECRKAENLDKQECKDFMNNATQQHTDILAVDYDPNKPYDIAVKQQYTVVNQPKFSGCAKYGKKYVAYTEQGTILKNVSQDDCKRLLEQGDRPYDYFTDHKVLAQQQALNQQSATNYEQIKKVRELESAQQSKDVYAENLNVNGSRDMLSDQNKFKNYDATVVSSYK